MPTSWKERFAVPKHRRLSSVKVIDLRVAEDVVSLMLLKDIKKEAAVKQVGQRYNMDRRRVFKALERYELAATEKLAHAIDQGLVPGWGPPETSARK